MSLLRASPSRRSLTVATALTLAAVPLRPAAAQRPLSQCSTYRTASTVVGAGLGAAVGAIPATIVHRHDKQASHAIVAVSITSGALIGLITSGRDHPCTSPAPDSAHLPDPVIATRERHAWKGTLAGAIIGGALGVWGGNQVNVACESGDCHAAKQKAGAMIILGGTGAFAGGLLGTLVGWAWPAH